MKYPILQDKAWLEARYIGDKLSPNQISKLVGCSRRLVADYLKKSGIKMRSRKETRALFEREISFKELSNKDWLAQKYIVDGLSTQTIADLVGAKSSNSVRQALTRFSLPIRDRVDAQVLNKEEDYFQLNMPVIEGCLLGDAHLKKTTIDNPKCWPAFNKKNIHYDHMFFVGNLLFAEAVEDRISKHNNYLKVTGKTYTYFLMRSLVHQELIAAHERWYPSWNNYVKVIPEDLEVSSELMLHWFLDDGCASRRRKGSKTKQVVIILSSESFEREQQEHLCEKLNAKFGLRMKTTPCNSGTGWRIRVPQAQAGLFYEIIGRPPVESLSYKWK